MEVKPAKEVVLPKYEDTEDEAEGEPIESSDEYTEESDDEWDITPRDTVAALLSLSLSIDWFCWLPTLTYISIIPSEEVCLFGLVP